MSTTIIVTNNEPVVINASFFRRMWNKVTGFFRTGKTDRKQNIKLSATFAVTAVAVCSATVGPSMIGSFIIKTLLITSVINILDGIIGNVENDEDRLGKFVAAVTDSVVAGVCIAIAAYFTSTLVVLPLIILVSCVIYPAITD